MFINILLMKNIIKFDLFFEIFTSKYTDLENLAYVF